MAMTHEFEALYVHNICELLRLKVGMNVSGCRWVYKILNKADVVWIGSRPD